MLNRILPARIDNRYRGHPVGLWLFVPIALIKLSQSLTHLLKHDGGAQSISTIPLDTYPAGAAQNVIGLFARLGLEQLLLASIFLLVLIRYRSLRRRLFRSFRRSRSRRDGRTEAPWPPAL